MTTHEPLETIPSTVLAAELRRRHAGPVDRLTDDEIPDAWKVGTPEAT